MLKTTLYGRLAKNPTIEFVGPNKLPKAYLRIACSMGFSEQGERTVQFVPVTVFGKQASAVAQYKRSGDFVVVEANVRTNQFTDKDTGKYRETIQLIANRIEFGPKLPQVADDPLVDDQPLTDP